MVVVVMDKHSSRTEHSDREHGGANANQWQIDRSSEAESPWSLVHSEPFIVAVDAVKSFVNDLRAKNRTRQQLGVVSTVAPRPIFPKITLSSEKAQQKQQEDHAKLNRLVDSGDLDLSNDRVLRAYLRTIRSAKDPATVRGDSAAIANHLQNGKIDLSEPRLAEVFLGHSRSELSIGIPEAVDAGKIDFSNEKIVELFLDSINDLSPDSTSALTASGIPTEKIMSNAHIQRVAIGELSRRIHAAKDQDNDNGFSKRPSSTDEADDSYCLGVLDKLCTTKEGEQHLLALAGSARVSIQGLGDYCSSKELNSVDRSVGEYASHVIDDEPSASLVKRNDTLKKLGWEPFKDDTSLAELFDHRSAKQSEAIQRRANQLGLITPEVTDRLYTYQYHKLLNKAKKGEVDSETFGYTIDPDLTPSGNDSIANYWYEQSKLAGGDVMRLCMKYTSDAIQNYDIPDTSEFIKEDGTMQDAFFRNRKGSLLQNIYASPAIYNNNKKEEIMKLLEAHENQTSEADGSKAMINMLSKMKDEDGKYDIEAMRQLQLHIGRFCVESPDKLFDEGKPTDEFYSLAFKQSFHGEKYIDKFMSHINSHWQDHYGDTGRKYLELVSTYPSRSDAFSDERTEWIKNYLDAGGPTNELFDEILLDGNNITIFGKHPEWQVKLADDKKSLVKFCEECNLSGYSIREYGLTADNLSEYFDANGPTSKMKEKILFNDVRVLYRHPELQEGLSAEQKSMVKFCEEYDFNYRHIYRYRLTADNLSDYFDANGPTSKMKEKILLNNVEVLHRHPELQEGLSAEQKSMVKFCEEYDFINWTAEEYGLTADNLSDYFDANGPTSKMKEKILLNKVELLYQHPELQEGLSAEQKSMVKFYEEYDFLNWTVEEYGLTADNLSEYFDADGPTGKMKETILLNNVGVLRRHPELQEGLSAEQKSMVKFCEECNLNEWDIEEYGLTADNLPEHFDANGPMLEFLQKIFLDGDYGVIYKYYQSQDEAGRKRLGLDDKWLAIIDGYGSVGEGGDWNSPHNIFGEYVSSHYDELTAEQIRWTADIITRLANSNASELSERSEAFAGELLKLDSDKIPEALTRIEDIYIHNHLPYVGKNYLVFRTMHPSDNLENDFDFGSSSTISPVLQQATGDIRSGKLDQMLNSRDTIIISDLLRASLGSNNRSIREYLTTLKNGQTLLDQLSSGELDWGTFNQPTNLMDKDTKASYDTLSTFAWHLATIYNSTLPGKEHPYQLIHQQADQDVDSTLQSDFTNLTSLIKPNSRYTLADRAVRYFAHFVGIEDLAGAEQYMDNIVKEADARNRKTAEYLATTSDPKLQPGDLVKGMGGTDGYGIRYLSYAFQNGSISKEYLGDSSRSDTTPLDTDLSVVLNYPDDTRTIDHAMRPMLTDGYSCGLWAVLRSDEATGEDRFIVTRRNRHEADQDTYDPNDDPDSHHKREALTKLEAFATKTDGPGHYGIRTGFGMDKVSYYISDRTIRTGKNLSGWRNGEEYTPVSEVAKLEIALGGFYIPIIDKDSEELIFTPADYDKMRQQMSGLSYYHTGDYQFAPDSELELPSTRVGETTIPSTSTIIEEIPEGISDTDRKHAVINQAIKEAITNIPDLNLSYKDYLDGDLTENIVEMIDTGSTGRQTNAPGSGDFDYIARLDRSILNDPTKKQQITDALLTAFGKADEVNGTSNQIDNLDHNEDGEGEGEAGQVDNKSRIVNGNLRLKQVSIDGLAEPVDIDITFAQKTNKVQYPTDAALADRLDNIKNQSEAKYQQVLANIIYAKQFLKASQVYKPRRSPEAKGIGGLGGVGIENWVLQHGGSFKQAARDFLTVADNCSSFEDFCAHYPVWDYGENHKGIRSKPHDNFVADNMNPEGYERMKEALRAVVN
mgnify:CR=1 FL=1